MTLRVSAVCALHGLALVQCMPGNSYLGFHIPAPNASGKRVISSSLHSHTFSPSTIITTITTDAIPCYRFQWFFLSPTPLWQDTRYYVYINNSFWIHNLSGVALTSQTTLIEEVFVCLIFCLFDFLFLNILGGAALYFLFHYYFLFFPSLTWVLARSTQPPLHPHPCQRGEPPFKNQPPPISSPAGSCPVGKQTKGSNIPPHCLPGSGSEHWVVWKTLVCVSQLSHVSIAAGAPAQCHLSQSHACSCSMWWWAPMVAPVWALTHWWGASLGLWGSFALLQARAPHTRTKDTRRAVEPVVWQDRDATQRNLGEEMRAWERESRPGERSREDTGKRHDQGKNRLLTYCMKLSKWLAMETMESLFSFRWFRFSGICLQNHYVWKKHKELWNISDQGDVTENNSFVQKGCYVYDWCWSNQDQFKFDMK